MSEAENYLKRFTKLNELKPGTGMNRVFGSEAYAEAAEDMRQLFESLSMESYVDSVGNVHGIYSGGKKHEREVLIGSHLDTVKDGGIYDGLLGVVAGAECVRRLQEEKKELPFDIHLIATNGEEGNELGGTFGSRCLVGTVATEDPVFMQKAADYQLDRDKIEAARYSFDRAECYLELHIEQGPFLEREKKKIGIVTGIVGLQRYHIHIQGMSNHSGTTMMEYRKDALVMAAELITYADKLARSYPEHFVATIQRFTVSPNTLAVINGEADMVLECRCSIEEAMEDYCREIRRFCCSFGENVVTMEPLVRKAPVLTAPELIRLGCQICEEKKIPFTEMPSGATHDGNMIAKRVPIGMIFVPSHNGVSHSPEEYTASEDCEMGVEVLYQMLLALSGKR